MAGPWEAARAPAPVNIMATVATTTTPTVQQQQCTQQQQRTQQQQQLNQPLKVIPAITTAAAMWEAAPAETLVYTMETVAMTSIITVPQQPHTNLGHPTLGLLLLLHMQLLLVILHVSTTVVTSWHLAPAKILADTMETAATITTITATALRTPLMCPPQRNLHVVTTVKTTWAAAPAEAPVSTMATAAMTSTITVHTLQCGLLLQTDLHVTVIVALIWEAARAPALVKTAATVAGTTTLTATTPPTAPTSQEEAVEALCQAPVPSQALTTQATIMTTPTVSGRSAHQQIKPFTLHSPTCSWKTAAIVTT